MPTIGQVVAMQRARALEVATKDMSDKDHHLAFEMLNGGYPSTIRIIWWFGLLVVAMPLIFLTGESPPMSPLLSVVISVVGFIAWFLVARFLSQRDHRRQDERVASNPAVAVVVRQVVDQVM